MVRRRPEVWAEPQTYAIDPERSYSGDLPVCLYYSLKRGQNRAQH
jgi:hypothetical protein